MGERIDLSNGEQRSVRKLRIAFLASHNGTDMQAIVKAIHEKALDATPVLLISNNSDAPALQYIEKESPVHFSTAHISQTTEGSQEAADRKIAQLLEEHHADVVILCGYMKKIGPTTLAAFPGRILNVHPALLPDLKGHWGDSIHEEVIRRRQMYPGKPEYAFTGVTIHEVDEEYDHGSHVLQAGIKIQNNETPHELKLRIQALEKTMYIQVLQEIISGTIVLPKKKETVRK